MRTAYLAVIAAALLSACATMDPPDPLGDGTYVLTQRAKTRQVSPSWGPELVKAATELCASSGRKVSVLTANHQDASPGRESWAQIQFYCAPAVAQRAP